MATTPLGSARPLGSSGRIEARLERIEALLERLAPVLENAPQAIATVGDIVDEAARSAAASGHPVEPRVHAAARLADTLSRAENLAALERIAATAPALAPMAEGASQAAGVAAMVGDMVDEWSNTDAVGLDARLRAFAVLTERFSRPETCEALLWGLDRMADLPGLAATAGDIFDEGVGEHLARIRELTGLVQQLAPLADAARAGLEAPPRKVSFFGLFKAMRDPDVQRGVGLTMNILQSLGRAIGETNALARRDR